MNRRAAIEFSANVIVVIVISSVILGLGLMLFFNLKAEATRYTDEIEQQTAEQLKALMLNDNSKVAVYPNDLTIQRGKSQMTTVAVMNNFDNNQLFTSPLVRHFKVEWYQTSNSTPIELQPASAYPNANPIWWRNNESIITSKTGGFSDSNLNLGRINPGEQGFRNVLIKMPKTAKKGEYVITINITHTPNSTCGVSCPLYGLTKIYVTVP